MIRRIFLALALIACLAPAQAARKTENVVVVTLDGYRWQELFGGANDVLMASKGAGGAADPDGLKARFGRETPEARREAITPFIWGVIAKQGQIFGDQTKNAPARLTNGLKFSYPGYNEMFCGFGDPRIDSNDKKNNPNLSVLEFLNGKPAFKGKVAVIATWGVFPYIFRASENGLPVFADWTKYEKPIGEGQKRVNMMIEYLPHYWPGNTFDLLSIEAARDYIPEERPRVLYIGLGETDEWAHARRYDLYLGAAFNSDRFLAELWAMLQGMRQYKDKTTLLVTTDHGRGGTPADWTSHGKDTEGAEFIWTAVLGPDTPALGVRENVETTQSQLAATIAAFLGEDFRTAAPQAAPPLPGVGAGVE